jgi:rhomboid protease GluP
VSPDPPPAYPLAPPSPIAEAFHNELESRPTPATWALLAAIAIVFALWSLWGGDIPASVRMGAVVPGVAPGQPWRLLAYALLHANLQHLLANGFSLLSLGRPYERILGTGRFLVLFVLSAIGGGALALALKPAGVMVGASGALWGLLGMALGLSFRPGDTLPPEVLPGFREATHRIVFIQVLVSFAPGVSWQAHLGGGLVGLALMASGLLRPTPRGSLRWALAGAVAALALAASFAVALATERPWELFSPPALRAQSLPAVGITAALPGPLQIAAAGDGPVFAAGDALRDGFEVRLRVVPHAAPVAPGGLDAEASSLARELSDATLPRGITADGPARVERLGRDRPVVARTLKLSAGVALERRIVLLPRVAVIVEVTRRRDDERTATVAARIADSVRPSR